MKFKVYTGSVAIRSPWYFLIFQEQRQATRENVERKQARTSDELEVCSTFLCILVISIQEHNYLHNRKKADRNRSAFSNFVDFVAGRGRA